MDSKDPASDVVETSNDPHVSTPTPPFSPDSNDVFHTPSAKKISTPITPPTALPKSKTSSRGRRTP